MRYRYLGNTAVCIGCGEHDYKRFLGAPEWLRVDFDTHWGVCTVCWHLTTAWDIGLQTPLFVSPHQLPYGAGVVAVARARRDAPQQATKMPATFSRFHQRAGHRVN